MKALRVVLEAHWGLSINHFFGTKSRPALRVIPPTTLIGALSYPIIRMLNKPEVIGGGSAANLVKSMIKGVYYAIDEKYDPFIPYSENNKLAFYKKREKILKTDAAPLPRLYSVVPVRITVIYLIDEDEAERLLGDRWEEKLLLAAASMVRIGARESIITVHSVELLDALITRVSGGIIKTRYTIPLDSVKPMRIEGNYRVAKIIDWRRTSIGDYLESPTTLIAQPTPKTNGGWVTVREDIPVIRVGDEYLIPWYTSITEEVAMH